MIKIKIIFLKKIEENLFKWFNKIIYELKL